MKRTLILFSSALLLCSSIRAQIAKWIIPPRYDHVQLVPGTTIYKGGVNDSTYLWNLKGEKLLGTRYYVGPFVDNVAVVANGNELKGIVNTKGRFCSFSHIMPSYEIDTKFPVFSCGYLLVRQGDVYYFLNTEGQAILGPYSNAYPFYNDMASVVAYENPEKLKGEYKALVKRDRSMVNFMIRGKHVDEDHVTFCSSLNDQKKAVVIIKKDAYIYDADKDTLTHLSTDGTDNKKNYLQLPQSEVIQNPHDDGAFSIYLGKGEVYFDRHCLTTRIQIDGANQPQIFERTRKDEHPTETQLAVCSSSDGASYGVDLVKDDGKVNILPPQFSDVSDLVSTNAVVCSRDKYGVVTVDYNSRFNFTLNDGNDIGFAHGKYHSSIQVSLPGYISWQNAVMTADKADRCDILPVSRTGADTREGNYLKYECNLFIPEGLTENRTDRNYHFSLNYDGLQSPSYAVPTKTWYIQQYDVTIDKQGVKADTVWVQVGVNKKADIETDNGFWFNVDISSPDIHISRISKKIDENTYVFKIFDIPEGSVNVSIDVNEDNCPPIRFPYVMTFKKAQGKAAGAVSFRKKEN